MTDRDYLSLNKANWNSRVPHHVENYGIEKFLADSRNLSDTVAFDVPRLGDIAKKATVHLQCHIGTDTLSLHRLGAHVTGLDFSAPALEVARKLARDIGADVDFVEADVYSATDVLPRGAFDLVYTGIGALCWLPSVAQWAEVVSELLKHGGELFIREGHPMLWSLCDPRPDGLVTVDYPYFETNGEVFTEEHSYVDHESAVDSPTFISFNHGLAVPGGIRHQLACAKGLEADRADPACFASGNTSLRYRASTNGPTGNITMSHRSSRMACSRTSG